MVMMMMMRLLSLVDQCIDVIIRNSIAYTHRWKLHDNLLINIPMKPNAFDSDEYKEDQMFWFHFISHVLPLIRSKKLVERIIYKFSPLNLRLFQIALVYYSKIYLQEVCNTQQNSRKSKKRKVDKLNEQEHNDESSPILQMVFQIIFERWSSINPNRSSSQDDECGQYFSNEIRDMIRYKQSLKDLSFAFKDLLLVLKFNEIECSSYAVEELFDQAKNFTSLKIEFHHCRGGKNVKNIMELISSLSSLKYISFLHCRFNDQIMDELCKVFMKRYHQLERNLQIETIEFISVSFYQNSYDKFLNTLKEYPFHMIHVKSCDAFKSIDGVRILQVIGQMNSLQSIGLSHLYLQSPPLEKIMTTFWKHGNIKFLDLSDNDLSSNTLIHLSHGIQQGWKLEELNLSRNFFSDKAAIELGKCLVKSYLKKLLLNSCKIGYDGGYQIFNGLINHQYIEYLDLGSNYLGSKFSDVIGNFLLKNSTCKVLKLEYIYLGETGCTELLVQGISQNTVLTHLDLSENRLRDDSVGKLCKSIYHRCLSSKFITVALRGNLITSKGAEMIVESFNEPNCDPDDILNSIHNGISILDLRDNKFGEFNVDQINCLHQWIQHIPTNSLNLISHAYDDEV